MKMRKMKEVLLVTRVDTKQAPHKHSLRGGPSDKLFGKTFSLTFASPDGAKSFRGQISALSSQLHFWTKVYFGFRHIQFTIEH